jgi:mono/diheme cytochrome c family protein
METPMRNGTTLLFPLIILGLLSACVPVSKDQAVIERGRYLVQISGCNDCHTEDFMEKGGNVPEEDWLIGSRRGWYNEQGTTYATNLRLLISRIGEEQWVAMAHSMRTRAPMAWYRLREINDSDLRAIYRYVRWLGPAGQPAPSPLPAGVIPPEPYINFPLVH